MPSLIAAFSALAALSPAFSAPLAPRTGGPITLTAVSDNQVLNGLPITASGRAFYIGVPTNGHCGLPAPQCSDFTNTTTVLIDNLSSQAGMYGSVPQSVYIPGNGVLSFTEPGQNPPEDALRAPFDNENGKLTFTGGNSPGWVACPTGESNQLPYQVMALVSSMGANCASGSSIEIATTAASEKGAYEYL